ncbi:MAG: hypothetical protein WCF84_07205 [Anaerolineae bacterium]
MPQYEYSTVRVDNGTLLEVNGQQIKSKQETPASDYFTRMGAEGWRLFSVAQSKYLDCYTAFFRRPKPAAETGKWAYATVFVVSGKVNQANGQDYKAKPQPSTAEYLNHLSGEGWEVMAVAGGGDDESYTVILEQAQAG